MLPAERTWGAARLTLTLATTAAATWCYLIGESVGSYLGFIKGGIALSAGCFIGMLLVLLAAGPSCVRFGIDSVASTKPQFGTRGWIVPAVLAGRLDHRLEFSPDHLLRQVRRAAGASPWVLRAPRGASPYLVPLLTSFACAVIFVALRRGASGVSLVSNILFAHVFVGTLDALPAGLAPLARAHRRRTRRSPVPTACGTTPPASSSASARRSPGGPTSAP